MEGTSGASLTGVAGAPALRVQSSRLFTLRNLAVSGGGAPNANIRLDFSEAVVRNCVIEDSTGPGILANDSSLTLLGSTVRSNTPGISLNRATALVGGSVPTDAVLVEGNNDGIDGTTSDITLTGNVTIRDNRRIGLFLGNGSSLNASGDHVIEHNGWFGILLLTGSAGNIGGGVIRYNGATPPPEPEGIFGQGAGLIVSTSSTCNVGPEQITDNVGYGLALRLLSSARVSGATIASNTFDGVYAELASGPLFINANTISGNGGNSVRCTADSWVSGALGGIALPIKCGRR
jgi:hypothetical protein